MEWRTSSNFGSRPERLRRLFVSRHQTSLQSAHCADQAHFRTSLTTIFNRGKAKSQGSSQGRSPWKAQKGMKEKGGKTQQESLKSTVKIRSK